MKNKVILVILLIVLLSIPVFGDEEKENKEDDEFSRVIRTEYPYSFVCGATFESSLYSNQVVTTINPYLYFNIRILKNFSFNMTLPISLYFQKTYSDSNVDMISIVGLRSLNIGCDYTWYGKTLINDFYFNINIPLNSVSFLQYSNNEKVSFTSKYWSISPSISKIWIVDPAMIIWNTGLGSSFIKKDSFLHSYQLSSSITYVEIINSIFSYRVGTSISFSTPKYSNLFNVKGYELYKLSYSLSLGIYMKINQYSSIFFKYMVPMNNLSSLPNITIGITNNGKLRSKENTK